MDPRQFNQMLAAWARSKGIKKPRTREGMQLLVAQFLQEALPPEPVHSAGIPTTSFDGASTEILDRRSPEPGEDDFAEMIDQRHAAMEEAGGDDLARDVILQGTQHAELNAQAPFTRINPPSVVNNPLGNQVQISGPDRSVGLPAYTDPILIARWDGNDAETTSVTAVFGPVGSFQTSLSNPINGTPPKGIRPLGVVQFGTRGWLMTAEVDIMTGAQLSVCASTMLLFVRATGTGGPFPCTAMISMGPCVRTGPLTRTVYWNALAGGNATTSEIPIPPFAKNVWVTRDNGQPAFTINIDNGNQNTMYSQSVAVSTLFGDPLPLTGDAEFFNIVNTSANTTANFWAIFQLGI
jgi:hypothetical protein